MVYLKTFAPWIVFAVVSAFMDWRYALTAGLVACVVVGATQGRAALSDVLAWGTLGFFVVLTAVAWSFPKSPVDDYTSALSLGTLGVVAFVSLAFRRPFTMTFAKQETPREFWDHPWFYRINAVLSGVWAATFLVTGLACLIAVLVAPDMPALWIPCQVIGFVFPIVFTERYPDRALARLMAQAEAQPASQPA
jgi:hypothetical protein